MTSLQQVIDSLILVQEQLDVNKQEVGQLKREIDHLKLDNDHLRQDMDELKLQNDRLKQENEKLRLDNDQSNSLISSINNEVSALKSLHCIADHLTSKQTTETTATSKVNKRICPNENDIDCRSSFSSGLVDITPFKSLLLNSLPQNCLTLILARIPLQKRIQLRIVCHHWKFIIELLFRSVRMLKLCDCLSIADLRTNALCVSNTLPNRPGQNEMINNVIILDLKNHPPGESSFLPRNIIQPICHLLQLFSNVIELDLLILKSEFLTIVFQLLLEHFSNQLISLALDFQVCDKKLGSSIWQTITRMPRLTKLVIYRKFFNDCDFGFFRQLRHLKIVHCFDSTCWSLDDVISSLGPNLRILDIQVPNEIKINGVIIKNSASLGGVTFCRIHSTFYPSSLPSFRAICRHFVSLTELHLDYTHLPFDVQLNELSRLKHLAKVTLRMDGINFNYDLPIVRFRAAKSLLLNITMGMFTEKVNPTEQIRILDLFNQIPAMFPVLEVLDVHVWKGTAQCINSLLDRSVLPSNSARIKYKVRE